MKTVIKSIFLLVAIMLMKFPGFKLKLENKCEDVKLARAESPGGNRGYKN